MVKFFPRGVLLALLVVGLLSLTQEGFAAKKVSKKADAKNDPTTTTVVTGVTPAGATKTATTSVIIDTIPNALTMWGGAQQPVSVDPASDAAAVIYRHNFGGGSGQIAYKASTDGGATWGATQGPLNGTLGASGRYPNITLVNPTNGTDPSGVSPVFVYPFLVGGAFGGAVYGNDAFVNGGAVTISNLDTSSVWGSTFFPMQANDASNMVLISATAAAPYDIQLLKSTDNGASFAASWSSPAGLKASTMYDSTGGLWNFKGWDYVGGKWYVTAQGYKPLGAGYHDTVGFYDFIIYKSTDGSTWTSEVVRPSTISALSGKMNYTGGSFGLGLGNVDGQEIDFCVDKNGGEHFFTVFASDTTGGNVNAAAVWELTNASGSWAATKIADLHGVANFIGTQRFSEVGAARNAAGDYIAVKWVDFATASDTIPDIFVSSKSITGSWSTAANITNTSQSAGPYYVWTQNANRLSTGGKMTITWVKQKFGIPDAGGTGSAPYTVWAINQPVTAVPSQPTSSTPTTFALHQNYPNPFNPTTNIVFDLPKTGFVTLKVFNVLGQEVATPVNSIQSAGSHTVTFNASNLSSGVYFYRLSTTGFMQTYKMVLQK